MIKNVLQEIGGIGLYGLISICLFFLVFSFVLVWACYLNKETVESMSALPLEDESTTPSQPEQTTINTSR